MAINCKSISFYWQCKIALLDIMGVVFWVTLCAALQAVNCTDYASNPVVQLFQEYLRIDTTSDGDLTPAVQFWKKLAEEQNLPISVYEYKEGYPVVVIKWAGTDSSLSSIMLNSHMDVVPAYEEDGWTYPPFSATIDENGNIYARGTQDMKSVSIQNFEAMRQLQAEGPLLRDVYMTLMPDEEVGGEHGMQAFLESEEFAAMNVGVEMDEGTSFPLPLTAIFYQDKVVWQIQVDCYGEAAHGSSFPDTNSTATGKCNNVINRLLEFRNEQYEISEVASVFNAGIYTSVNLNKINAGIANNVIPQQVTLVFDIRPATTVNEDNFEAMLNQWLTESGSGITLSYILKDPQSPATVIDNSNPYWVRLAAAAQKLNFNIMPLVPPGSTDARFVRNKGIPAFGFSPMPNTPLLLHSVNEYLNAKTFLQGIEIYKEFIKELANIAGHETKSDPFSYVVRTNE